MKGAGGEYFAYGVFMLNCPWQTYMMLTKQLRPRTIYIIVTFASLLGYDLWTVRRGEAPEWYGQLRLGLTAAVVLCLTFAILANRGPV
mgnify:CR=1 FL=1